MVSRLSLAMEMFAAGNAAAPGQVRLGISFSSFVC